MGELTPEQIDYTHSLLGVHPNDFARPGDVTTAAVPVSGQSATAGATDQVTATPWSFSPTKQQPPSLRIDSAMLQAGLDAADEAKAWVRKYLRGNKLKVVAGASSEGTQGQVMFNGTRMPTETAIATTVAAGGMANLKSGDIGRRVIDHDTVAAIIKEVLARAPSEPAGNKDADDDDGPQGNVEVTPDGAETSVQFTINLRAVSDKNPNQVLFLQSIDVTLHLGKDAGSSSVEAQLNLVKVKSDITKRFAINGHVLVDSIEFTAGVSAEGNMSKVALLQVKNAIEVKVKAELEFKITSHLSFSLEADAGKDGVTVGPKLVVHF